MSLRWDSFLRYVCFNRRLLNQKCYFLWFFVVYCVQINQGNFMIEMKLMNMNCIYIYVDGPEEIAVIFKAQVEKDFSSERKLCLNIRVHFIYPQCLNFRPSHTRWEPSSPTPFLIPSFSVLVIYTVPGNRKGRRPLWAVPSTTKRLQERCVCLQHVSY